MSYQDNILQTFQYVECGRDFDGGFSRNDWRVLSQVLDYRTQHGNKGMYMTAFCYDSMDMETANLYGNFYLDFDHSEDIQFSQEDAQAAIWMMKLKFNFHLPESAFRIYFSGNKGFHIIVPAAYFGYQPHRHLNEYFKMIARELYENSNHKTLDLKIYDKRRLLRMPNSQHTKTGLFKIPLTYQELCTLTPDEIREKAKTNFRLAYEPPKLVPDAARHFDRYIKKWEERYKKKFDNSNRQGKPLDIVPDCIQHLLDSGPLNGKRNETAAILSSFFKNQGLTQDEAWQKLCEWNNGSLQERELETTMKSIWSRNVQYGCSTLEHVSLCTKEKCRLYRKKA